jgi:hypothetical protein
MLVFSFRGTATAAIQDGAGQYAHEERERRARLEAILKTTCPQKINGRQKGLR